MIRTSEGVADLFAALAQAQAVMPVALKSATGQAGNAQTTYADLPAIKEAIREPLSVNGLGYVQFLSACQPGFVRVVTRLFHKSGEWIEDDEGFMVPAGNTAQSVGSATTYAKRYSLAAALGVVADDDDDGHAATQGQPQPRRQTGTRAKRPDTPPSAPRNDHPDAASTAQINLLLIQCQKAGVEEANRHEYVSNLVGRPIKAFTELSKVEISKAIDDMKTLVP